MSEEKSVRQLERELKQARIKEGAEQKNNVTISRDYSVVGVDPSISVFFKDRLNTNKEAYQKYR